MTELFAAIVAGVAPAAGCGSSTADCDPNAGRPAQYLMTVIPEGGIMQVYDPLAADAGVLSADASDCAEQCQTFASMFGGCGHSVSTGSCRVLATEAVSPVFQCDMIDYPVCTPPGTVCGRRPRFSSTAAAPHIGEKDGARRLLAEMAQLEADSVLAFRDLARSLAAHRAPRRLVERARQAAADEVRHARIMARLVGGPRPASRRRRATGTPSLAELSSDNAAEGCVRETFGALLASWQATHAGRADVREAMATIAIDETRHAALAWDIDAWAARRLAPRERRLVESARRRAARRLEGELQSEWPQSTRRQMGLASRAEASALFRGLSAALWR